MSAKQVLIFLLGIFAALGVLWLVFPADGIAAGPLTIRYSSYQRSLADAKLAKVNVDSVLRGVDARFRMEDDTLHYYRTFFYENPDRIYLPEDDFRFFDPLFRQLEQAREHEKTIRVLHYGDSQIEMDRISQDLRDGLQERFGGMGTGFFPALSNVPSASVSKSASGSFVQYTMYGDSTTVRAGHNRYGQLAQVVQLSGGGTVTLRASKSKYAKERTKDFSTVGILYGRASQSFEIKVVADTLTPQVVTESGEDGVVYQTWHFSRPVQKATVQIKGSAEIYGISADGDGGAAVDNVPLRGCSGTIFTRISKPLMKESLAMTDTRLIILQFGGNYMPVTRNTKIIEQYQEQIAAQIQYFHEVAPQAKILFIGPSDMGKSVNGRVVTWPRLPELVDSLKSTALRNDAAYWDLYRMMGGENSMVQWVSHNPPLAGPDYIHLTPLGAQKVGETLTKSLLTYYDFYQLRKTYPQERQMMMEK
jgi:lysophospholipase L1-like esterase